MEIVTVNGTVETDELPRDALIFYTIKRTVRCVCSPCNFEYRLGDGAKDIVVVDLTADNAKDLLLEQATYTDTYKDGTSIYSLRNQFGNQQFLCAVKGDRFITIRDIAGPDAAPGAALLRAVVLRPSSENIKETHDTWSLQMCSHGVVEYVADVRIAREEEVDVIECLTSTLIDQYMATACIPVRLRLQLAELVSDFFDTVQDQLKKLHAAETFYGVESLTDLRPDCFRVAVYNPERGCETGYMRGVSTDVKPSEQVDEDE